MDKYKDGEPCSHKGCLNHVTHPCEGCGRIAGQNKIEWSDEAMENCECHPAWKGEMNE